jgi:dimethylargininase
MEACELTHLERRPIDITLARKQHAEYCQCLRELGAEVIILPAEPDFPDAVFVEDPAVVLDEAAIMTRLGAISRRGESATLALELARHRPLAWMNAPATLEGGDVMRVGRTLFVGLSTRTNEEGVQQLRAEAGRYGYRVQPVIVHGCLHLKSAVSYLGDDTVLLHAPWVDPSAFAGLNAVDVPESETESANVLIAGGVVLVAAGFPKTAEKIERLGRKVVLLDNSEIRKAEGALTCCSLLLS